MERLTEQIKNKETGEVLAYRLFTEVDRIRAYRKLGELEDLEEQKLLLRLPCKVGDTVWCIEEYEDGFEKTGYMFLAMCGDYYIVSPHLVGVSDINDQLAEMEEECRNWGSVDLNIFPKNRVFLTKAEAEKALAEMGV
jgi:hypothetical protein